MGTFDEKIGKQVSRRSGSNDPIADAAILLDTAVRLRGRGVCPSGVFRFKTFEEADQWALRQSVRTPDLPG
ncbi:MAG: hypothetical protein WC728_14080 [Elusimicrobiota bacterium]